MMPGSGAVSSGIEGAAAIITGGLLANPLPGKHSHKKRHTTAAEALR